jgi:hypothetical protein
MIHEVFISYTRADEGWARKLEESLAKSGLKVFRDLTRLNAGDEWEPALRDAIVDSQSLVVLWSKEASKSKWVAREQEAFRQMMHVDAREGKKSVRRMLQVCLEGANPEYPIFQTVADLDKDDAYKSGAAQVDPNLWARVLEKVERGVTVNANLPVIHQVILASTRDQIRALADDRRPVVDAAPYADLIQSLNLVSKQELVLRYGDDAPDWRPFGGQKSIVTLMSELREELLGRGAAPFLWKYVSEDQWNGIDKKRSLRDQLKAETCVIVLDAVSLYDAHIWERYDWLLPCLDNQKAAIATLPPYCLSERNYLRTVLEAAAAKMFEPFYRPDRAQFPIAANCCVLADDHYELSRLVASMIRIAFGKEKNEKLRFGSRQRK